MSFSFLSVYAQSIPLKDSGCLYIPPGGSKITGTDGIPTIQCFEVIAQNFLTFASAAVFLVLFIMLIVGAFRYILSEGDKKKVDDAQKTMQFAVIGLVLYVSAYLILNIIQIMFLGSPSDPNNRNLFKFEIPITPRTP